MTIFDHFDAIRIVNLAQRTDRRRAMNRELARVGLAGDPRVAFFSAIRPADAGRFTSIGARGVYLSQKHLLREAAAARHSLLILEDDCLFLPGAADRVFGKDWDIFYGGYTASDPHDLLNSDVQGAHMMGFSAVGAHLVSQYLEQLTCEGVRSEEHTSELQSLMRISYAVFCLKKKKTRAEYMTDKNEEPQIT